MYKNSLHIHCFGISHHTAGVALREKLAFSPHQLEASLARLGCGSNGCHHHGIGELVILSTCNRVELYATTTTPHFENLKAFLTEAHELDPNQFPSDFYHYQDEEAIRHLLNVAAGLDSVVLGEPQILGQVTDAYATARRHGTTGKILSRLFESAIHAGKRARTETAISHNPASVASVAVKLIAEVVPQLDQAHVMVLGAGEMAELVVESLRKRSVGEITVINRTVKRAKELAQRWNGQAAGYEKLIKLIPQADIVITSTGAPHTIIQGPMVARSRKTRTKPQVYMDIAVPRDVDTAVGDIPGISLFNMDTLETKLEDSLAQRAAEIPHVTHILEDELTRFMEYLATLDVVPIIVQMRSQAEAIRQAEMNKTIQRIPDLRPEAQQQIEALTRSIVQKILHSPTIRLREEANGPNAIDYAEITRDLFGLD